MADRPPFDPGDPFDALADMARQRVGDVAIELLDTPEWRACRANTQDQVLFTLLGMLTGVCGVQIAMIKATDDDTHRQMRAWLVSAVPQAFDMARQIALDLPPLPEPN